MNPADVLKLFKEKKALLEGHFELASGRHSPFYLQCALVLQYPDLANQLCELLAKRFQGQKIDLVVGPAIGGIIIAYEMGRILRVRAVYAERKNEVLELRRGFEIREGENILLVEDVVTTGGSLLELAQVCNKMGARVVGAAAWVDRTGGKSGFPFLFHSLVEVDFPTYDRDQCPLCEQNLPLVKPGSQKIKAVDR